MSAGVPYFRVGRRGFAKLRHSPDALVVWTGGLSEKEAMIRSAPGKFFSTAHYDGAAAVLVRLEAMDLGELADLLVTSWRLRAPEDVRAAYDQKIELGCGPGSE
jgi:hypothetical protein